MFRKNAAALVSGFCLLLAGCTGPDPDGNAGAAESADSAPVPILARVCNDCPCCEERGSWLIRDEPGKKAHYNCGFKSTPFPELDWNREWAISATTGERGSYGHWIKIESVERRGDRLVLNITENTPRPDEGFGLTPVRPFCLVKIPAQPGVTGVVEHRVAKTGGILLP